LTLEKIRRVLRLAQEFGNRATLVLDDMDANDGHFFVGTKASGALRRTSMELTRALADLRRRGMGPVSITSTLPLSRAILRQPIARDGRGGLCIA
jgi:hypothetical protein